MTPLVTWKSLICCPYPTSPPFPRKRVPLLLLEWLRKEQNSIFPFIQRMFLGLCSFHVSGRQCYFITVHFPKWLKCPGTHTCGMSHQKLGFGIKLQTCHLSDQGKAFLLEALDVSHCLPLQGPQGLGYR